MFSFFERWLVFPAPPHAAPTGSPRTCRMKTSISRRRRHASLHGWYVPAPDAAGRRAVLPRQRRACRPAWRRSLKLLRDAPSVSVFAWDYRGYGHSEGKPHETNLLADARAAQLWLAKRDRRAAGRRRALRPVARRRRGRRPRRRASRARAWCWNARSPNGRNGGVPLPVAAGALDHEEPVSLGRAHRHVQGPAVPKPRHGRRGRAVRDGQAAVRRGGDAEQAVLRRRRRQPQRPAARRVSTKPWASFSIRSPPLAPPRRWRSAADRNAATL